jgi:hypothetical protein
MSDVVLDTFRDGTKWGIVVDTGVRGLDAPKLSLRWEAGSELSAELIRLAVENNIGKTIQAIRAEAYALGWKDKAGKKTPKKTEFSGRLGTGGYVGS